jgi:predicted DNA-binding transcriptional regulator AlpA
MRRKTFRRPTKRLNNPAIRPQPPVAPELIIAAKLCRRLGVSIQTLYRWRHDPLSGFPQGRRINHRVYFEWTAVYAWLDQQQRVA